MDLPSFSTLAAVQQKEEDSDGIVKVLEPPPIAKLQKNKWKNGSSPIISTYAE